MLRRGFFKKMTAALGVSMAAPLVLATNNNDNNAKKPVDKDTTLHVIPKPEEKGGLDEQELNIVRKLNDDFRASGKLVKIIFKNVSKKNPEKGYKTIYFFDSKQSKALYLKQKEELLANHVLNTQTQEGLA